MKFLSLLFALIITSAIHAQIVTGGGIVEISACDFEEECAWIELDTAASNQWQTGFPSKPFFDTSYSAPNCIMTDSLIPYSNSNLSSFQIPLHYEGGDMMFNVGIRFWHKYQTDSLLDGGFIEFSYDYGDTWANVYDHTELYPEFEFYQENLYGEEDTLIDGTHAFTGTSDWTYTQLQWIWMYPLKVEVPDTLLLRFNFISDSINTSKDGWMIDNISSFYAIFGGVDEYGTAASLQIFPNPSLGATTVKYENHQNESYSLSVINTLGQELIRMNGLSGSTVSLETRKLAKGIYEVQILKAGNITAREKLVVQ
ncbi:MAG: T9SS type A sorting domain-containing protein [Crocinitomix sp.]|nr:T9SS type A sorting domain-containing protein [Crocinitomix sp.]